MDRSSDEAVRPSPAPTMPLISLHLADCDAWPSVVFAATLSAEEQARANRFRNAVDSHRFIVRRGLLRRLLGERLGIAPAHVPLEAGPAGKPSLSSADSPRAGVTSIGGSPHFNLARSGGLALYAFLTSASTPAVTGPAASGGPSIGVDLERIDTTRRSLADLRRIADHFAPEETRLLESLPDGEAIDVFYRLWTCKEACLKCLGTGIGGAGPRLDEVVIALHPDGTASGTARTAAGGAWRVACLTPCPGHTAAVALPAEAATSGEHLPLDVHLECVGPTASERAVSRAAAPPPGRAPGAP